MARKNRIVVSGLIAAVLVAEASCTRPVAVHPFSFQDLDLPKCNNWVTPKKTVRIYLNDSIDKILDGRNPNNVTCDSYIGGTSTDDDLYNGAAGGTRCDTPQTDQAVLKNSYHVDLNTISGLTLGDNVEVRYIMSDINGGQFWRFMPGPSGYHTIGVFAGDAGAQTDVCFNFSQNNLKYSTSARTKAVTSVFVHYYKSNGAHVESLNIGLVPRGGPTETPVFIDPKIKNSG
jgi:hypothetical protein